MGNPSGCTGEESPNGFGVAREQHAEPGGNLPTRRCSVQLQYLARLIELFRRPGFFEDVAHQQFQQILDGRDAVCSAVFVQHDGHLVTLALQLEQDLGAWFRSRRNGHGADR